MCVCVKSSQVKIIFIEDYRISYYNNFFTSGPQTHTHTHKKKEKKETNNLKKGISKKENHQPQSIYSGRRLLKTHLDQVILCLLNDVFIKRQIFTKVLDSSDQSGPCQCVFKKRLFLFNMYLINGDHCTTYHHYH